MAKLFRRLKETIEADFHDILDEKERKNPISVLNQYLRECEKEVEKVRKLVERQYMLSEEFTREYEKAAELAEKRKHQAEIALQANEEELHKFAVQEHEQYSERAARLKASKEKAVQQLEELEQKYEVMQHKLKDMYIKRMELMGRENITRAHHRMDKVVASNEFSSKSFSRFGEIEQYLDRLEHQVNSNYHRHTIDARIAQLEKEMQKEEKHTTV
ncbi:PspA/IM30 family protein [Pseudalkalibacillus salsuginis]|uniref:PspA/IM30 family protein n=1 Tax=Pseudalkalibacillus salsuginis TaxID=2910972 RepID=UPI001F336FE4|nr:PspA/IM30 family protein [Pseudalkalibacillus salsuginis]MCF6411292.1 PspA/IM30 family protein [Pseudalkalibacillus salsuginis]